MAAMVITLFQREFFKPYQHFIPLQCNQYQKRDCVSGLGESGKHVTRSYYNSLQHQHKKLASTIAKEDAVRSNAVDQIKQQYESWAHCRTYTYIAEKRKNTKCKRDKQVYLAGEQKGSVIIKKRKGKGKKVAGKSNSVAKIS